MHQVAARQPRVDAAQAAWLDRRLERRQVEILLAAAAQADEHTRTRREQRDVDDWVQHASALRERR